MKSIAEIDRKIKQVGEIPKCITNKIPNIRVI